MLKFFGLVFIAGVSIFLTLKRRRTKLEVTHPRNPDEVFMVGYRMENGGGKIEPVRADPGLAQEMRDRARQQQEAAQRERERQAQEAQQARDIAAANEAAAQAGRESKERERQATQARERAYERKLEAAQERRDKAIEKYQNSKGAAKIAAGAEMAEAVKDLNDLMGEQP